MNYNIINKASFHKLKEGEEGGDKMSLSDAFLNNNIKPLYLLTGYPKFNPVEQAFSYLKHNVATERVKRELVKGWTKNELTQVIIHALSTITHEKVKSWYCGNFRFLFPCARILKFLQLSLKVVKK